MPLEYLTTFDVAEKLGVSARTVLRWDGSGKLAAAAVAGSVRLYDPADVEAMRLTMVAEADARAAALRGTA
jgi:excisionase family DNA binding protein